MVADAVRNVVIAESGGLCGNPDCRTLLACEAQWIGEIAHISGERPGSERYDPTLTDAQRGYANNLIALCPTCHTRVDKRAAAEEFPAQRLLQWKRDRAVEQRRSAGSRIRSVQRAELVFVIRAITSHRFVATCDVEDLTLLSPDRKLEYNGLSDSVRDAVTAALSRQPEMERAFQHLEYMDAGVRTAAASEITRAYEELSATSEGDRLFWAVVDWARQGDWKDDAHAAALVVVAYYFERCDIFERVI